MREGLPALADGRSSPPSGRVGGAAGKRRCPSPCLGAALARRGARPGSSEEEEVAAAPGRRGAARSGAARRGPAEAPPAPCRRPRGCAAQTFCRAAGPCGGAALPRHLPVAEPGGGWGAAPERGGRARAAAGGGGGGGSAVSGAGRLRPPGILQHRRAALRPPPVPGTAAQPPGPASKLSEGGGRGGSGADRGLPLGRVGAAERGERLRGSDSS